MALQTVDDLRDHALFLAGEPTSSASGWYVQVVTYLDEVQRAIIAGGTVGEVAIDSEHWPWALKTPRASLRLLPAFNITHAVTFTFTKDSTTVTVSSMTAGLSVQDYHLVASSGVATDEGAGAFVARVTAHTASATTMTIDRTWPHSNATGTAVVVAPLEYSLPSDFMRFASPLYVMSDAAIPSVDVVGAGAMEADWPVAEIAEGIPAQAAIIGMDASRVQRVRMSHYMRAPVDLEFEYIYTPAALTAGVGTPVLPEHQRRLLALGAAYLIACDKQNDRKKPLHDQFVAALLSLIQEYKSNVTRGSAMAGMVLPRRTGRDPRRLLRTTSGSIIG
jgi:hypothetical protein